MQPPTTTLVLGGTRSGKSEVAEALVLRLGEPASYVATGRATDADMAARIAAHQERRGQAAGWAGTIEVAAAAELPGVLERLDGPVLVDSLGTWLASFPGLDPDVERLGAALSQRRSRAATVLVSEEVGLGVHPPSEVGRVFADRLGGLNQAVAAIADHVLLVVAGRVLPLPASSDELPW